MQVLTSYARAHAAYALYLPFLSRLFAARRFTWRMPAARLAAPVIYAFLFHAPATRLFLQCRRPPSPAPYPTCLHLHAFAPPQAGRKVERACPSVLQCTFIITQ